MVAKVVALLGIGALYGLISLVGSVSVGAVVLSLRDQDAFPSSTIVRTLALSLLVLGLWALIGLGIGILIPNQVAALLIGVGVAWIVEPLLGFAMTFWEFGRENIAQFMPSSATNAVIDDGAEQPGRGAPGVVGGSPGARHVRRPALGLRHLADHSRGHQLSGGRPDLRDGRCALTCGTPALAAGPTARPHRAATAHPRG